MSTNSKIEWTDATWNPVSGCTRVSAGCDHCYAVPMTRRLQGMAKAGPQPGKGRTQQYIGLTVQNRKGDWHFNGKVRCVEEALDIPLRKKTPTVYFVNSMSDLFHKDVPFEFIDKVFAVMALCPQHSFQILTKRPARMAEYLSSATDQIDGFTGAAFRLSRRATVAMRLRGLSSSIERLDIRSASKAGSHCELHPDGWPLPNVWLGTSCEDQQAADERIPHLLRCPAAVRFLSCEPLLGSIDLLRVDAAGFGGPAGHKVDCIRKGYWSGGPLGFVNHSDMHDQFGALHWVIVGGESGPKARPMRHDPALDWFRLRYAEWLATQTVCPFSRG